MRSLRRNSDMGRKTPKQKKEERSAIAADIASATTFVRPRHKPITEQNRLDIFVDSSPSAFAAAAHLNGQLCVEKFRLATVSPKTIPELELMAMVFGSHLGQFLGQTLRHLPIVVETTYWSDSQVCKAWLKSTKTLKNLARNRVKMNNIYKC